MSVRLTPAARAESATSAAAELLDLDEVACSHLTTAISALPDRAGQQATCGDAWADPI
jgi:hypothetical protein